MKAYVTITYTYLALEEAADINMFLSPLRPHFEEMEECDYLELEKRLPAIMHVICLIWANSKHYQQPARLVVLLQETANLIIDIVSDTTCKLVLYQTVCDRPRHLSRRRFFVWSQMRH